jgi:hypothetical protein
MMLRHVWLGALPALLALGGCATGDGQSGSPTGALLRGRIAPDQYLREVERANIETREQEQREFNRENTRAYNTRTGRYEYVPADTQQYWNEHAKRWEFTPVEPRDRPPPPVPVAESDDPQAAAAPPAEQAPSAPVEAPAQPAEPPAGTPQPPPPAP